MKIRLIRCLKQKQDALINVFAVFSRNINELPQHSVSGCWGSLLLFNLQMCNSFRQINWLFTLCDLAREVGNLYLFLCVITALVML